MVDVWNDWYRLHHVPTPISIFVELYALKAEYTGEALEAGLRRSRCCREPVTDQSVAPPRRAGRVPRPGTCRSSRCRSTWPPTARPVGCDEPFAREHRPSAAGLEANQRAGRRRCSRAAADEISSTSRSSAENGEVGDLGEAGRDRVGFLPGRHAPDRGRRLAGTAARSARRRTAPRRGRRSTLSAPTGRRATSRSPGYR